MGAIHVTPADQTLFITAIGAMGTVVTILWKRQNDKDEANKAEMKELLKESNAKCEAENLLLRKDLFTLKEEIGYLKGLFKSFKQDTNPKTTKGKDEKV
jgi:tagatose-1,6-bisphosphate aldolase